tara:strand:- start:335 stop:883 length:549 start_codon:yes stop_codon:yes gene_type:complete
MAGQRLTDKTALTEQTGSGDQYMVVDVSDTTGSSAGTSKKFDSKFVIQTDKISVSSAETQALKSTPKTLVSAPGSGYAVIPFHFYCDVTYSSTESAKLTLIFGHTGSNNVFYSCAYIQNFMNGVTANAQYIVSNNGDATVASGSLTATPTIDNIPLYLSSTGNFSGGFSMDVYVTYHIIKLL